MEITTRISPLSFFDEFWNPVHIIGGAIWAAIWGAFYHYLPYLLRNRTIIRQKLFFSLEVFYVILMWIHSDFFSVLSIMCLKGGRHKIANLFKMQAFRTLGTVPLLAIAHDIGHSKGDTENFPPKEQCKFCKYYAF